MIQAQVALAGLPITLVLLGTGEVVFVPIAAFTAILEVEDAGINARFFPDEFSMTNEKTGECEEFSYRTTYNYKLYPNMLAWLKQQRLQQPQ